MVYELVLFFGCVVVATTRREVRAGCSVPLVGTAELCLRNHLNVSAAFAMALSPPKLIVSIGVLHARKRRNPSRMFNGENEPGYLRVADLGMYGQTTVRGCLGQLPLPIFDAA